MDTLSYFITDGVTSLIGMARLKIFKYLKGGQGFKGNFKELKDYGTSLMGRCKLLQFSTSLIFILLPLYSVHQLPVFIRQTTPLLLQPLLF